MRVPQCGVPYLNTSISDFISHEWAPLHVSVCLLRPACMRATGMSEMWDGYNFFLSLCFYLLNFFDEYVQVRPPTTRIFSFSKSWLDGKEEGERRAVEGFEEDDEDQTRGEEGTGRGRRRSTQNVEIHDTLKSQKCARVCVCVCVCVWVFVCLWLCLCLCRCWCRCQRLSLFLCLYLCLCMPVCVRKRFCVSV